jgi:hypothetical protein
MKGGAHRRPAARRGAAPRLRCLMVLMFALIASAAHSQAMMRHDSAASAAHSAAAAMACCEDMPGAGHATPACAGYVAPALPEFARPDAGAASLALPVAAPARDGLKLAPPRAPPRLG